MHSFRRLVQNISMAGSLTLAFAASIAPAGAATSTISFMNVSTIVLPSPAICVVGVRPLAQGQHGGMAVGAISGISIACSGPEPYQKGISADNAALLANASVQWGGEGRDGNLAELPAVAGASSHRVIVTILY